MANWSLEKTPAAMNSIQVASWSMAEDQNKKRHEKAQSIVKIKPENVIFNKGPQKPVMSSYQGYSTSQKKPKGTVFSPVAARYPARDNDDSYVEQSPDAERFFTQREINRKARMAAEAKRN